jgi:hypothetical protein
MKKTFKYLLVVSAVILISSCQQAGDQPVGTDGWLTGDAQQKFETVADHLGGFGRAMWEVGYRFRELYWAGQDMNWEYAGHQIVEMQETLEAGLERRPARAASAQQFLSKAIPDLEEAIAARDGEMFEMRFNVMMNTCNSCHALEEMPFLTVALPAQRGSSIR